MSPASATNVAGPRYRKIARPNPSFVPLSISGAPAAGTHATMSSTTFDLARASGAAAARASSWSNDPHFESAPAKPATGARHKHTPARAMSAKIIATGGRDFPIENLQVIAPRISRGAVAVVAVRLSAASSARNTPQPPEQPAIHVIRNS